MLVSCRAEAMPAIAVEAGKVVFEFAFVNESAFHLIQLRKITADSWFHHVTI